MKRLILSTLVLSAIIVTSCGSDDTSDTITNEILLGDQSFTGSEGLIIDGGSLGTHYQYSFAISDGDLAVSPTNGFQFSTLSAFFLSFGAASLGPDEFQTGTFQFRSSIDAVPTDNYFFSGTFIDIDNNNTLAVEGGTITISGTSPNFTVQFNDVVLSEGASLNGAYVGTFEIQ